MKADGILFDLDGTLWDGVETGYQAWQACLEQLGIHHDFTLEDFRGCMGLPMTEFFDRLYPELSPEQQAEISQKIFAFENPYILEHGGILYPKLEETLKILAKSYKLTIVSNCQAGYIEAFMKAHHLEQYFMDIECFGNNGLLKAENIRLVVERNHLKYPVYVGDVQGDADASHAAGVPIIYAAYGFGEIADAEGRVERFEDLPALLEK